MTTPLLADPAPPSAPPSPGPVRFPLLTLLHPRQHTAFVVVTGVFALVSSTVLRTQYGWPLWKAVALVLVVMAVPAAVTWRDDARRYGALAAAAGALVVIQALHAVEHIAQWSQRHLLDRPLRLSNGLLSPANSEWVHFVWNWLVLVLIAVLFARGMRGFWGWALIIWSTAHALEHTYMFVRFLQVQQELRSLGVGGVTAQGLPGVVGVGGWLDTHGGGSFRILCGLPFVTTATRVDTHAAWNTGEVLLAIPAVHMLLRTKVPAFAAVSVPDV